MPASSHALTPTRPPVLREIDDLPHPPGLPLVGNLLQIDKPHIHSQIEGWVRRYGNFFTFSLGRQRLLVVADHAAMGAILRDRPEGFRRTPRFASIANEIGIGGGVFGAEGAA
ncbi:MAG TPA: cytochrome P450, partial [Caldimonas sp.]|nr:cytochrome P450 [Caldimonas sp.]